MSDESARQKYLPPLCLFFALALAITGFAVYSRDAPDVGMELHQARVEGDEAYQERLEADLEHRQWMRQALIAGLFVGAGVFTVAAFVTMNLPRKRAW